MKIEKVNDNQIRCTLTREDLANREIKISELAYGTDKAKSLFREMIQQASYEYGFEAEDIPLMIEAVPLNAECIVLIITKVEDPEELDTRFSKFSPSVHDEESDMDEEEEYLEELADGADDVLNMLRRLSGSSQETAAPDPETGTPSDAAATPVSQPADQIFAFRTLNDVIRLSHVISGCSCDSALYKEENGRYLLLLHPGQISAEDYGRLSYTLSEYGSMLRSVSGKKAYLEEHCEPIIRENAISSLAGI